MKILLINSPIRLNALPNCIPYGLATIASALRLDGHKVQILDLNALRMTEPDIIQALKKDQWDLIGISGLITTFSFQTWVINTIKSIHPGTPVVSGGGLATSNSGLLFDQSRVDITVIGEGEETMKDLCNSIQSGQTIDKVRGIAFRKGDKIHRTDTRQNIRDLDKIPFPAWDLLPMEIYLGNSIWGEGAENSSGFLDGVKIKRSMNVVTSRGCPFSCNYCYHLFGRASYRLRSAANVVDEIEHLMHDYKVDFVGFVDDNMMASTKRLLEFCDLLDKKKLNLVWGCHGRVNNARPDILERMRQSGCVWIGYGIESGSSSILSAMNKKATVKQAKEAIINTRKAGIYPNTTFIFGYPGETRETIQETINFKKELNLECGSFFATPYPGTPLYDAIKHKIGNELEFVRSLGNATEYTINLTQFSDRELFMLKEQMDNNENLNNKNIRDEKRL